jgi:hypothetical protein
LTLHLGRDAATSPSGPVTPKWAIAVIRSRYLVGALGETASPPWWPTQATTVTGQRFLARLFPRTYQLASLEAVSRAARREHDDRIGRIGVYHLFRLPSADEAAIYDALREPEATELLGGLGSVTDPVARLAALGELAGDAMVVDATGPIRRGTVADLHTGATLAEVCATYVAAFEGNRRAYPYLEEGKG